jgi:HAD superfamily hydrolase (TIGR01509 family)
MTISLRNARPVEAVIFNMDGLLVDTEKLAARALSAAACSMGVDVPEAFRHLLIDVPAGQSRRMASSHNSPGFPVQAYFESADRYMSEAIEAGELRPKPGVRALLAWLEEQGVPKAVATSSGRATAEHRLWIAGIYRYFDTIVTRDDLERGKPHPDAYLCAAERLGASPSQCLALENSHNGVRAAHGAGMQVVMVPDMLGRTSEMRAKCEAVVPDLHAVRELLGQTDASRPAFALVEAV